MVVLGVGAVSYERGTPVREPWSKTTFARALRRRHVRAGAPHRLPQHLPTRWTTTLSSQVNLPHAINFRASCGANLVTSSSQFRANETLVLHRAVRHTACRRIFFRQKAFHHLKDYRGTSLIRKRLPLGPYGRPMRRALAWS